MSGSRTGSIVETRRYVLAYANVTNAQKSFAKAQTYRKKAVEKCGNYAENRDMKEALEDEIAAWDDAISIELNSDDWVDWLVFLDLVPGSEASEATSKIAEAWGKEAG